MQLILAILCGISAVIWAFVLVVKYQDGTARNWERVFYAASIVFNLFLAYHHFVLWEVWAP